MNRVTSRSFLATSGVGDQVRKEKNIGGGAEGGREKPKTEIFHSVRAGKTAGQVKVLAKAGDRSLTWNCPLGPTW